MSFDFENTCRTCLAKTEKLTSLDKKINLDGETLDLCEILDTCTNLKIVPEENMPQRMCIECVSKLSRSFTFRKQCWEADALLRAEAIKEETIIYEGLIEEENLPQETWIEDYIGVDEEDVTMENLETLEDAKSIVKYESDDIEFDNSGTFTVAEDSIQTDEIVSTNRKQYECEWQCAECGLVFHTKGKYRYHISSYHDPNYKQQLEQKYMGDFECEVCGKKYNNLKPYKRHLRLHDPDNPNRCHICGRVLTAPSLLEIHLRIHSDNKPFECAKCGKRALTQTDLNTHMRFHTGERPYKCSICEKAFITVSHCRAHEITHATDVIYECNTCQKRFKSKRALQQHVRIHQEEKHIQCKYCDRKFATSKHILAHMRTHAEFVPLNCELCDKKFSSQSTLDTHFRIHHAFSEIKVDN